MIRNTYTGWGSISRLFHWGLGFLIIGMLAYGWWMNHMAARPDRFFHRSIHADIGYVVLLLMVIRLIWRGLNPVPVLPADMPRWQRIATRVSHRALYGVTILVAMLGWAHSGAHKPDYADWFGLFRVPQFTSTDKASANFYENLHVYLAYLLIALVVIHILAALYHLLARGRQRGPSHDPWRTRLSEVWRHDLESLQSARVFLPRDNAADNSVSNAVAN